MRNATPAEDQVFNHRRKVALLIELGAILVAPLAAVTALILFGDHDGLPRFAAGLTLILVFAFGQVARHLYYRCPVCAAPLSRGSRHARLSQFFKGHCAKCKTDFAG